MGSLQSRAEFRTILVAEVRGFSASTDRDKIALRRGIYEVLRQGWATAGVSWDDSYREARGDGALVIAPAETPPETFLDAVPDALDAALRRHNASLRIGEQQLQMGLAVNIGEVAFDENGAVGESIDLMFRLLESGRIRDTLTNSPGGLAMIASRQFFDEVVRHSPVVDPAEYRPVAGVGKQTSTVGWIRVPSVVAPVEVTDLPVTIYLADERIHEQVQDAVENLLDLAGAEIVESDDPVFGSWFRRLWAKAVTSPTARDAAVSAAHALDAKLVLSQDASITATMLQNLGPVLTALQPTPDAVLRIGALLIVKADDVVAVHQLTAAQQLTLDHQPHLLTAPQDILSALNLTAANRQFTDAAVMEPVAPQISNHGQVSAAHVDEGPVQPRPSAG